VFQTAR
jgi:phosphatidylinositol 4-kinase A